MNKRRFLLPATVVTAMVVSACGGGDDEGSQGSATGEGTEDGVVVQMDGESREDYLGRLYDAAKEEGTVAYYQSANDDELQAIIDAWGKAYPDVEFEPVSASSGTILERALLEAESGNVKGDVYGGSAADQDQLAQIDALADYDAVNEEDVLEQYRLDGPYVATGYLSYHPAFNVDQITEEELPTEWEGYCEPAWKGKFAIDQEGGEWATGILTAMGEEEGRALLECLAANEPRLVRGSTNRTELLASGEFPVMLDGYGHRLWEFEQEGSPIKTQATSPEPLTVVLDMASVFQDAPHPNAARLLLEFFLTEEGQQVFLDQNKGGTLESTEAPYAEYLANNETTILGPEEADFEAGFQAFVDIFLGGEVPAP